jgi:uncharacterized membrane protein YkoI
MPMRPPPLRRVLAPALIWALALGAAHADDVGPDTAARLLKEGRIRPLAEIVDAVKSKVPGELMEVELELEDGTYVYDLKLLRPNGRVQEVEADAATGKILKIEDDD